MKNRITELFGIEYPVIQGGMVWCSGWRLAAAVSEAGGLGLLGAGSMHPETLLEHIRRMKEATRKPWGINLPLMYPEIDTLIDMIIAEGVKIVFTSAGSPKKYTARFHAAVLLVGRGDFDAIENSLRCRDLIIKYRFNIGFVSLFLERAKPFSNGISQPQARYGHFTVCAHIHATAVASPPPCSLEILTFGYICPSSLYAIVRIRSP